MHVTCLGLLVVLATMSAARNHGNGGNGNTNVNRETGHLVVCYYPNWSQYRPDSGQFLVSDIDPRLCTHVLYAFAQIVGNDLEVYEPNDPVMYAELNALKQVNPQLRTMLSVGGATMGLEPFEEVASSLQNRVEFSVNVVEYLRDYGFDGVDIDWEFPRAEDRDIHRELMVTLREAFELEAVDSGRDRLLLSGALGAARSHIYNSYDLEGIAEAVDFANVMTYDLHGGWDPVTGFHSALHGYYPEDEFAQDWVVEAYLSEGFPAEKMVLGVPTYGRSFTLCEPSQNDPRDCSMGYGEAGEYTQQDGILAYYEICADIDRKLTREYDSVQKVPYAHGGDQWIGYDDRHSVKAKVQFTRSLSLAGLMFWDMSMDDFSDSCGDGPFPLINAAKSSHPEPTSSSPTNPTRPIPTTTRRPPTTRTTTSTRPSQGTPRPPTTTRRPLTTRTTPSRPSPTRSTSRRPPNTTTRPTAPTMSTRVMPGVSCEGVDDLTYIRSPLDCSVFYQCVSGVAYRFQCPPDLFFDTDTSVCNWDYLVDCDV